MKEMAMAKRATKQLTPKQRHEAYLLAKPKQFGNLHERMKFVMEIVKQHRNDFSSTPLWHPIFDLETEVSYSPTVDPPHGQRGKNHKS